MLEGFLARCGLIGIFIGAGIEGEAATIAGGVLAHRQLVSLWGAMAAAATGSCFVDRLYFFLGRWCRRRAAAHKRSDALVSPVQCLPISASG